MKKARAMTMTLEGGALLQKLELVAPKSARAAKVMVERHGAALAEDAVKLALAAFTEGKSS